MVLCPLNNLVHVPADVCVPKSIRSPGVVKYGPSLERHVRVAKDGLTEIIIAMVRVHRVVTLLHLALVPSGAVPDDLIVGIQQVIKAMKLMRPGHFPERVALGVDPWLAKPIVFFVIWDVDVATALFRDMLANHHGPHQEVPPLDIHSLGRRSCQRCLMLPNPSLDV